MYYLGIDCGTQGTKAVVLDSSCGVVVGKGYSSHDIIIGENGESEQYASWWIDALLKAVNDAIRTSGINPLEIEGIGVSGQQHGLVLLDENGTVIRKVKLWNDTSTSTENDFLLSRLGGPHGAIGAIGSALPVGYAASKVLYVREREKELFSRVRHVLLPHDYINFYLTGEYFTDSSEASGTGYYDVQKGEYSPKMLSLIDPSGILEASVPKIIPWNEAGGVLLDSVARQMGLKAGIPVAAGGGDNTMGALGTACFVEGSATISLGTSGTICISSPSSAKDVDELLQVYRVMDRFLVTACTLNATSASTSVQELFSLSIKEFDDFMAKAEPGSGGVISAQFFSGERMPSLPQARGFFKNLSSVNFSKENMIRATAEAVVYTLRWGYDKILKSFPEPQRLIITGGGGNSAPWRKIVADVMGLPLYSLKNDEGGALGGAIQAEYMARCLKGEIVSIDEISSRCVQFDESRYTEPEEKAVREYKGYFTEWKDAISKEWNIDMGAK